MSSQIETIARREAASSAASAKFRFPDVDPANVFDPRADFLRRAGVVPEQIPTTVMTESEAQSEAQAYLTGVDRRIIEGGSTVGETEISRQAGEEIKRIKLGDLKRTRVILPSSMTIRDLEALAERKVQEIEESIRSAGLTNVNDSGAAAARKVLLDDAMEDLLS